MQFSASCRCSSYCFNKNKVYISAMSHEVVHEVISIASDQWYLGRYSIYGVYCILTRDLNIGCVYAEIKSNLHFFFITFLFYSHWIQIGCNTKHTNRHF